MGHRIEVTSRVDYPDGSARVMVACMGGECFEGHVEADPGAAADVIVARLMNQHHGPDDLVGELAEAGRP